MKLFGRNVKVIVGDKNSGFEIDGNMKITATVTRDMRTSEPDSCTLTIYNLGRENRSKCVQEDVFVSITAGYETPVVIFAGEVQSANSRKMGVDWVTTMICGDKAKALKQSKMVKTYAKGTRLKDVIYDAGIALGTDVTLIDDNFKDSVMPRGRVVDGQTRQMMDTLGKAYNFQWTIQHGRLIVLPKNKTVTETPYLINQDSGLVGTPDFFDDGKDKKSATEYDGKGVKIKTLLMPDILPGQKIVLESESLEGQIGSHKFRKVGGLSYRGVYKVRNVTHNIDTDRNGGDFTTDIEALGFA